HIRGFIKCGGKTANADTAPAIAGLRVRFPYSGEAASLLFCTESGHPFRNGDVVSDKLKPILRAMGADTDGLGLHGFRRASASAMDSLQTPMKVRQERLGHGSLAITMNYTSSNSSDHLTVASELGKMFDPIVDRN